MYIHKAFSFGVAPSSSHWIRSSAINERNVCTSSTDNDTALLWLMQKGAFVETKAAFAGCADLNLAGLWVSCRKFIDAVMTKICQSVINRVYTSHFGNGTVRLEPRLRWY